MKQLLYVQKEAKREKRLLPLWKLFTKERELSDRTIIINLLYPACSHGEMQKNLDQLTADQKETKRNKTIT